MLRTYPPPSLFVFLGQSHSEVHFAGGSGVDAESEMKPKVATPEGCGKTESKAKAQVQLSPGSKRRPKT